MDELENLLKIKGNQSEKVELAFKDQISKIQGLDQQQHVITEREKKLQYEFDLLSQKQMQTE